MVSDERSFRGKVAIVGVGETTYYKRGQAEDSEFVLCIEAIKRACDDAGMDPKRIDGIAAYSDDRNDPVRISTALGLPELRFNNMQWGGGGGGGSGAVGNAAAAIATGYADCVVLFRALAQGQFGRFGQGRPNPFATGITAFQAPAYAHPYGLMVPAQNYGLKAQRLLHQYHLDRSTMRAVSLASYYHAQQNPGAVMHGRPLSPEDYDNSRWIAEPYKLFDCCMENDGAAALILVSADRAKDFKKKPVYVLGAATGSGHRHGATSFNSPDFPSSNFKTLVPHLYEMAKVGPQDIDVVQAYENFTAGVVMSIIEHGLCSYEEANDFFTFENLKAATGKMPLNTSGGNLAHCYMHGLELQVEAVRQLRGESYNQVPDANVGLIASGPMTVPVSTSIFGTEATL